MTNSRQGDPNPVGNLYRVLTDLTDAEFRSMCQRGHSFKRTPFIAGLQSEGKSAQYLLALRHTGDCHYFWASFYVSAANEGSIYFSNLCMYSAYSVDVDWAVLTKPLDEPERYSVLIGLLDTGRADMVLNRKKFKPGTLTAHPTEREQAIEHARRVLALAAEEGA